MNTGRIYIVRLIRGQRPAKDVEVSAAGPAHAKAMMRRLGWTRPVVLGLKEAVERKKDKQTARQR